MIIAICGFMGAGKSSFLKQYPEVDSVDTDLLIEGEVGAIGDFVRANSWDEFRAKENLVIQNTINETSADLLISLGGGSLDSGINLKLLKKKGVKIIFLQQDFDVCLSRIQGDTNRPQLDRSEEELKSLFTIREEIFKNACDFVMRGDSQQWPTQWSLLKTLV